MEKKCAADSRRFAARWLRLTAFLMNRLNAILRGNDKAPVQSVRKS